MGQPEESTVPLTNLRGEWQENLLVSREEGEEARSLIEIRWQGGLNGLGKE